MSIDRINLQSFVSLISIGLQLTGPLALVTSSTNASGAYEVDGRNTSGIPWKGTRRSSTHNRINTAKHIHLATRLKTMTNTDCQTERMCM